MPPISPGADLLMSLLLLSPLLVGLFFLLAWPWLAVLRSPQADLTRIQQQVEEEGDRIVEVERDGTDWLFQSSSFTTFRKYRLVTEATDGSHTTRVIGVHCTLARRPSLVIYEDGRRAGLWGDGPLSLA
jgi:hypothetical protein